MFLREAPRIESRKSISRKQTKKHNTTGCGAVGSAGGLGACNTPGKTEKSEIPVSLENAGVLSLYPFRKISENRRLTTSLTTTAETEK